MNEITGLDGEAERRAELLAQTIAGRAEAFRDAWWDFWCAVAHVLFRRWLPVLLLLLLPHRIQAQGLTPGSTYRSNGGYVACLTEREFDELGDLVTSADDAAIRQMLDTGRCIFLRANLRLVFVGYVRMGVVKLRPKGERVTFVTHREAVNP